MEIEREIKMERWVETDGVRDRWRGLIQIDDSNDVILPPPV